MYLQAKDSSGACDARNDQMPLNAFPIPTEKVTEDQRLNRIGQPKFYCSVAAPAVFYELHAKAGRLYRFI